MQQVQVMQVRVTDCQTFDLYIFWLVELSTEFR